MPRLRDPFSEFTPLEPQAKMPRNELCWCRSGKKWKKCHERRGDEKTLPASAFHARFFEEAKKTKLCLHPDAPGECSDVFSAAHTIQKRTGLSALAENNHVLSGRNRSPQDRAKLPARTGINLASTFYGFCSDHDNRTFRPAEISEHPNEDVAFLLSYRALCFEIHMKKVAVQTLEFARDNLDRGTEFYQQAEIQQYLAASIHSNTLGYDEHMRLKKDWDVALISGDRSNFQWAFIQFEDLLPVASSGVYFPEWDFTGRALQRFDAPIGTLALMGFNILPIGGRTSAVFGWLDGKTQNKRLIDTLHAIPDSHVASALVQFAFDTSDNIFVRESWWKSLDTERRTYLEKNLEGSTPGGKWPDGLIPRHPPIVDLKVVARR